MEDIPALPAREPLVSQGNTDLPLLTDAGLGAAPRATGRDTRPGAAPAQGHPWGHVKVSLRRLGEAGELHIPAHIQEEMSDLQYC